MALDFGQAPFVLILLSFLELLLIIVPPYITAKIEKSSFAQQIKELGLLNIRLNKITLIRQLILGILLAVLLYLAAGYILYFFQDILILRILGKEFLEQAIQNSIVVKPFQPNTIELVILIIIQFLIVAPSEEGFFRAFLMKKMKKKWNDLITTILSSTIFALYHTPPFLVPLATIIVFSGYYFIIGVALSTIYVYHHYSLLPCIVVHSVFNMLVLLF